MYASVRVAYISFPAAEVKWFCTACRRAGPSRDGAWAGARRPEKAPAMQTCHGCSFYDAIESSASMTLDISPAFLHSSHLM